MIQLFNVAKSYGGGTPALADVSFEVKKGEFIFLTGPSGAGKTTLLKIMYRTNMTRNRPSIENATVIVATETRNTCRLDLIFDRVVWAEVVIIRKSRSGSDQLPAFDNNHAMIARANHFLIVGREDNCNAFLFGVFK